MAYVCLLTCVNKCVVVHLLIQTMPFSSNSNNVVMLLKHNDVILLSSPNQAATENSNMAITWTQNTKLKYDDQAGDFKIHGTSHLQDIFHSKQALVKQLCQIHRNPHNGVHIQNSTS